MQDDWLVNDVDLSKYLRTTLKQHLATSVSGKSNSSVLDELLNMQPDGLEGVTDNPGTPEGESKLLMVMQGGERGPSVGRAKQTVRLAVD